MGFRLGPCQKSEVARGSLCESGAWREDYDIWRMHELTPGRGHFTNEQRAHFEDEAVWLCARCQDVGSRNGRKLAAMAERQAQAIHQIKAQHSHKRAGTLASSAFSGLRAVVNLTRGCKVMLTKNVAYRYGLANGTRGRFVGPVYATGARFGPAGFVQPFPEALVLEVPDYCGPAFYSDEPTWVPILPCTCRKDNSTWTRTQFPVVAGFALTVNKAQGLTVKEGTVLNLIGSRAFRPASKHGLPFVAFTRSENFAMTAFKNLPPWEDFKKGASSDMLRMRKRFEKVLHAMHRRTMAVWSDMRTAEDEKAAFEAWQTDQARKPKRQKAAPRKMPCPACEAFGA